MLWANYKVFKLKMNFEQTLQETLIAALNTEAGQFALSQAVKKALQDIKQQNAPVNMNMKWTAHYLNRSIKTIEYYIQQAKKKRCKNPIPYHQPLGEGTAIYFNKNELELWLNKKKV